MSRKQTQCLTVSPSAALALAECLVAAGYCASADGKTVRTDAQLSAIERLAPSGVLPW